MGFRPAQAAAAQGGDTVTSEQLAAAIADALSDVTAGVLAGGAGLYISRDEPQSPHNPSLWIPLNEDYTPVPVLNQDGTTNWQVYAGPPAIAGSPDTVLGDALGPWWNTINLSGGDGASVGALPDLSAGGNNLGASTGTNRPTLKLALQNGKNMLRFTKASNQWLQIVAFSEPIAQPFEFWTVFKARSGGGLMFANQADIAGLAWDGTTVSASAPAFIQAASAAPGSAVHTWRVVVNGASSSLYCDGTLLASGDIGTGGWDGLLVGGYGNSNNSDIDWGEAWFSTRLCTTDEATALLTYTQSVWATGAP